MSIVRSSLLELSNVDEVLGALLVATPLARVYRAPSHARLERLGRHRGGRLLLLLLSSLAGVFCHELGEQLLLMLIVASLLLSG